MRKWLALLLILPLLYGCAAAPPSETTQETTANSGTSSATTVDETEPITTGNETAADDTTLSNDAGLEHQDYQIHIMEANWDLECYQDAGVFVLYLYFISDKPVKSSDIELAIPVEIPYTFELVEVERGSAPNEMTNDPSVMVNFTYDIYLHYRDFDWSALREQYQTAQALGKTPPADRTAEERKKYTEALNEYQSFYDMYREEYMLLDDSMLPQFEFYQISVYLDTSALVNDVSFENLTLTIAGESTTVDIGTVQLFAESYFGPEEPLVGISKYPLGTNTSITDLSGTVTRAGGCFTAEEDVLLTGYELLIKDMEIEEIQLQVMSASGKSSDFIWDGKMPVPVDAGSTVNINLTITDPRMRECGCDFKGFVWMEYELDGVVFEHSFPDRMGHEPNPYEEYARYFDGIDFTEYYEEYYYPIALGIEP